MKVEQIYTGCLAHAAYYIESKGEVAIIDPLREVQPYINRAKLDDAKIKYIFETHFHADFVSGHLDLAKKTDSKIVFGPTAVPNYDTIIAEDNQIFTVGDYKIKILHTPGHTMESMVLLLIDENDKEHGIISGDTLFIGDVGRPDLAQSLDGGLTQEKLAGYLFDSLRNKIMPLSDHLIVYPAHGAGSACGKNMSKETTDTLGNQKKTNYALRADMTKEEFVKELLEGLGAPPAYFPANVLMNINGVESIDTVIENAKAPLNPTQFEQTATQSEAVVLDVRHQDIYAKGHVPSSIFIGIDGGFAPWVGSLIADVTQPILLITSPGREDEVITRLSRIGFDNVIGYLKGGFDAWRDEGKEYDTLNQVTAEELATILKTEKKPVYDVREDGEYISEHIEDAIHTSLNVVSNSLDKYPSNEPFYVHCAGGYRSVIAASILKSKGVHNVIDVKGGFGAIKKTKIKVTAFVCPTTL